MKFLKNALKTVLASAFVKMAIDKGRAWYYSRKK
ncbi:hypothetical protein SEA_FAUST_95 [Streptomyces phage Faust]|jgi:hypothetical protein|uniref:Uncharacterized protein n=2 Tax=Faustvirus TaxID=3044714 RepID=A0A7G9UYU0_9CAUD|nr:hypothetical protein PP456_gp164 [Streptomyces phage Faust]YP_010651940.1 hypothetical protein PP457_gp159 [Streptomyces phage TunaTartare]QNN99195.1 hypothetical protein SEA_FAUST_95 [Streptomyces phage Faust]QWT29983.1 hypothetical protein SEA_TUNATARTARE_95 [Streptomyces phage TunaTartare]